MDQWTSNFRVKTPKRRELNRNFLIFPIPETLARWTELNQSQNLSVKQTKRQNTTAHLHYQHPVGKSSELGFNTSCQACSQESSGHFFHKQPQRQFWMVYNKSNRKYFVNAINWKRKNSENKQKPNSKMVTLNRTSIIKCNWSKHTN